jgi:ATP-dependent Clp protease ATP-binding subunit ClpC
MAPDVCDICGFRPATAHVILSRNGRRRTLDVCEIDLLRLQQQGRYISPFDALFAGEGFLGNISAENESPSGGGDSGDDDQDRGRYKETVDISQFLSQHAKEMIQKAAETAYRFGRREIDTEHLLYALTESEVIQEILRQLKLKPSEIRDYLDTNSPKEGLDEETTSISLSPRLKRVFEQSLPISQEMGHGYIGPEHLLISLAREEEGMAGDLLRKYSLYPQTLRQATMKVVGQGAREGRIDVRSTTPNLDKYSRDLSKLACTGKLDPVVGRATEIETTIEILSRRTKNNPALIGEPGVGKTAIVEGLAQRVANGDVPEMLQDKRLVELNLNSLVAGSKFRGELEERVKIILDEIIENQDELILFVDELHTIVGAGSASEGSLDIANILKPALARGELHLIGATTLNEYQKYIEKDAALERRFQPVIIAEPTVEQSIEILRGLRDKYEAHHKVKITDAAIVAAAELSDRYISNRFLPDKAIDLIDQASSRVRIVFTSHSPEMKELDERIAILSRELESSGMHKQFDRAKDLEKEIEELNDQREQSAQSWRKEKGITSAEVTAEHIAQIVSKITGIPVVELTTAEKERLLKMEERLHERVIGQEEAIRAISDAIRRSRSGFAERNRPIATFLFLGPTGVGKTELAKTLAWVMFGDEAATVRVDMSEYMERHSVARLIGAPPGYVGFEEGGQLTEAVRRRPYSVILLDEIEKAHPDAYNILLQVFDDGRLTDGKGRVVDFTNTIIIATSNIGSDFHRQEKIGFSGGDAKDQENVERERYMEEVKKHFRPEFVNRIDEIVIFHPLSREEIRDIVRIQLERVTRTAHAQNITLRYTENLINYLADVGYSPDFGARELRRKIQQELENKLARKMLGGEITSHSEVEVDYSESKGIQFKVLSPAVA